MILGYSKQQIYDKVNALRDCTMNSLDDLYLNEGIAIPRNWLSCNGLRGDPNTKYISDPVETEGGETILREWDNTSGACDIQDSGVEHWTKVTDAKLEVQAVIAFTVDGNVTIDSVAGTDIQLVFNTLNQLPVFGIKKTEEFTPWTVTVHPGEKAKLVRVHKTAKTTAVYTQDFALDQDSMIATDGNEWKGDTEWGFHLNTLLAYPNGTFMLDGTGNIVTQEYFIWRRTPVGRCFREYYGAPGEAPRVIEVPE
ncbi:hypothetical protein BKA62DRAFT_829759 [Auriculariales sp. MPI-PUGE-AT-0066]|nr:hypothetical protein BKA62DRAFT_829759 [Auriculariales sp. MPI-PUGE-AT-0066]